jgi:hypothetical protein
MKEMSVPYSQKLLMNFGADMGHRNIRSLQEMD